MIFALKSPGAPFRVLSGWLNPYGYEYEEAFEELSDEAFEISLGSGLVCRLIVKVPIPGEPYIYGAGAAHLLTSYKPSGAFISVHSDLIASMNPKFPFEKGDLLKYPQFVGLAGYVAAPFGIHTVLTKDDVTRDITEREYSLLRSRLLTRPLTGALPVSEPQVARSFFEPSEWEGFSDHPALKFMTMSPLVSAPGDESAGATDEEQLANTISANQESAIQSASTEEQAEQASDPGSQLDDESQSATSEMLESAAAAADSPNTEIAD